MECYTEHDVNIVFFCGGFCVCVCVCVCVHVHASFSPGILRAGAVKGLNHMMLF